MVRSSSLSVCDCCVSSISVSCGSCDCERGACPLSVRALFRFYVVGCFSFLINITTGGSGPPRVTYGSSNTKTRQELHGRRWSDGRKGACAAPVLHGAGWGRQRQSTRRELSSPATKCNTSTDRSISLRGTWLSSFSICTCHVLLERSCLSVDRLRRQGTQGQQSGDGGAEASCAHSRSLHIDPDRPEAVTGVSEML